MQVLRPSVEQQAQEGKVVAANLVLMMHLDLTGMTGRGDLD